MRGVGMIREKAEAEVVRRLERRWAEELPEGVIPNGVIQRLRSTLRYQRWVDSVMRGSGMALPDLDVAAKVFRRPDGSTEDLMTMELGDDPHRWYCQECGEEQEKPNVEVCAECRQWLRDGPTDR